MEQSLHLPHFPSFRPFSKTARAVAPLPPVPEASQPQSPPPSRASSTMTSDTLRFMNRPELRNAPRAFSMTGDVGRFSGREALEKKTGARAGKRIQRFLGEMQLRERQEQGQGQKQEHKHEQNHCRCAVETREQEQEQQGVSEIQNVLTECRRLVSDTIAITDKRLSELAAQQREVLEAVNVLKDAINKRREKDGERKVLQRQQVRELKEELADSVFENEQLKGIIDKVRERLQKYELPEKMVEELYGIIGGV